MDVQKYLDEEIKRDRERTKRKIYYACFMLASVYLAAIAMYHYTEGWSWEDSLYFTSATITTVGYGDIVPHTYYGRLLTIPLMFIGIGVGFYVIYAIRDYSHARMDILAEHVDKIGNLGIKKK